MDCVSQTSNLPSGWHHTKSSSVEVADGGGAYNPGAGLEGGGGRQIFLDMQP